MSRVVIVAGFHRSGTSSVAQLLHRAGLFVGDELIGVIPSNPYGHFEDREIVRLHEAILADNGRTWHVDRPLLPVVNPNRWAAMRRIVAQRRASYDLWGFKDPRACLFLHAWKHLVPEARVLVIYRHWADSAYSLERRHSRELLGGIGPVHLHRLFFEIPDLALKMWAVHNEALIRFAETYPDDVLVLPFEAMSGSYPLVEVLNERWAIGLTPTATTSVFDPAVTTPRPRRQPLSDGRLPLRLNSIWDRLEALAAPALQEAHGV
ncbi:MAG TPA: sulfotransferase [Acidimicrobiia bacterium]|nr:sulfotransferase [Acidimicrobiia bacterium]